MIAQAKNGKLVMLGQLHHNDLDRLFHYLQALGEDTRKRFGPHAFDKASIADFYTNSHMHIAYIATDMTTGDIVAYAIVRQGYLEHDSERLQSYGIMLNADTDCTFAPSVADAWQSCGVGNSLFHFMLPYLKHAGMKRIILWGGVQADNERAVNYYTKNGFETLGQFWYNGNNYDMVLDIG